MNENDGAFLMITWTNILITNNESNTRVRFGSPYVTQISRETGIADLHKILLKEMHPIIQPGILIAEQKVRLKFPNFSLAQIIFAYCSYVGSGF